MFSRKCCTASKHHEDVRKYIVSYLMFGQRKTREEQRRGKWKIPLMLKGTCSKSKNNEGKEKERKKEKQKAMCVYT